MTSTSKLLSITPRLKIQRVPKANLHGHSLNQKTLIRERHCWLRVKNVEYVCYQIRPFLHKLSSGLYKTRLKCIKKQTSSKLSLCVSFRAMHQIISSIANLINVDLRFSLVWNGIEVDIEYNESVYLNSFACYLYG